MGGIIGILLLILSTAAYWVSALALIIVGIVKIASKEEQKKDKGKKLALIGTIMLIVGLGFCGSLTL